MGIIFVLITIWLVLVCALPAMFSKRKERQGTIRLYVNVGEIHINEKHVHITHIDEEEPRVTKYPQIEDANGTPLLANNPQIYLPRR